MLADHPDVAEDFERLLSRLPSPEPGEGIEGAMGASDPELEAAMRAIGYAGS